MPNSLRAKLSKLRYKGEITQEEYAELIKKLDGHNSALLDRVAEKLKAQFKDMQFHTGRAWFDFDAEIDRCSEKVDKVIEDMKAEVIK